MMPKHTLTRRTRLLLLAIAALASVVGVATVLAYSWHRPKPLPFDISSAQSLLIQRYFAERKCPDNEQYTLLIDGVKDPPVDAAATDTLRASGWSLRHPREGGGSPSDFPFIRVETEWELEGKPLPRPWLKIGVLRGGTWGHGVVYEVLYENGRYEFRQVGFWKS